MVPDDEKMTYVCEKCGCESGLRVKEEKVTDSIKESPKQATLVCKVCGSEADTIFEEI